MNKVPQAHYGARGRHGNGLKWFKKGYKLYFLEEQMPDPIYEQQHGYYLEEISPRMSAVYAKTITEADVALYACVSEIPIPFISMRSLSLKPGSRHGSFMAC